MHTVRALACVQRSFPRPRRLTAQASKGFGGPEALVYATSLTQGAHFGASGDGSQRIIGPRPSASV